MLEPTRLPMTPERRIDYRIHYPHDLRPTVLVGGISLRVIDVSERGIRFHLRPGMSFPAGTLVDGLLELNGETGTVVRGTVLRSDTREAVAQLHIGPSFSSIRAERERLHGQWQ